MARAPARPLFTPARPAERVPRTAFAFHPLGTHALAFAGPGHRWPEEPAEPARPRPDRAAAAIGWFAVALVAGAMVLPFSLFALADLIRWLAR